MCHSNYTYMYRTLGSPRIFTPSFTSSGSERGESQTIDGVESDRERERHRQAVRQTERHRQRDTETVRQTQRDKDNETERHRQ